CHSTRNISNECQTCHLPDEDLMPENHGPDFRHFHGNLAELPKQDAPTEQNCQLCHQTSFCQECHEGENLDRFTHPLNYEFTHSLDARGNVHQCSTCHTDNTFCSDCHVQNGVLPHSHTAGWANTIPGDGGLHSMEARSDLGNCLGCHEYNAEQTCQKSGCHHK
ncbi:MAG: hypothetical protein WAN36_06590, partial [Calditrichia bacterium]